MDVCVPRPLAFDPYPWPSAPISPALATQNIARLNIILLPVLLLLNTSSVTRKVDTKRVLIMVKNR